MLTGDNTIVRNVLGLNANDQKRIMDFLKKEVYTNYENSDKWFTAKDLIGGHKFVWPDTDPLDLLYLKHYNPVTGIYASRSAAIDAGYLLKAALAGDQHTFTTAKGYIRKYHW